MDFKKVINEVVEYSGGVDNVCSVVHCATRLRLELNDEKKYDKDKLEDIEGVKGVFFNNGQLQLIFGSGFVQQVFVLVLGAVSLPRFISIPANHWSTFAIGLALSFIVAFSVTAYFFKTKEELVNAS